MVKNRHNTKKFSDALLNLKEVFDKHNLVFWLEAGTLLGAIREKRIIKWDDDADVSILIDNVTKLPETQKDFQKLGYEIYITNSHYGLRNIKTKEHLICIFLNKNIKGFLVKLQTSPKIPLIRIIELLTEVDYRHKINRKEKNRNHFIKTRKIVLKILINNIKRLNTPYKKRILLINIIWKIIIKFRLYNDILVRSPYNFLSDFRKIKFYGKGFNIPKKAEEYLNFRYGNWSKPIKGKKGRAVKLKELRGGLFW